MKIVLAVLSNEGEKYLPETVGNFLPFIDDVVVAIDDRCNDKSTEILDKLDVTWKKFKWDHDFSKAKNFLLSMIPKDTDWVIALSEDNKISENDCSKLLYYIKQIPDDIGGLCIPQKNHYPEWSYDEENYIKEFYPNRHCCVMRYFPELHSEGRCHENYSNSIIAKGLKVINYDEVHRHHHAWRGNRIEREKNTHYYYQALSQLPRNWITGDPLPIFKNIPKNIQKMFIKIKPEQLERLLKHFKGSEREPEFDFLFNNLPNSPARLLDIGCKENVLPFILEEMDYSVWAIDKRPYEHKFDKFMVADARMMPFDDNAFDIITCISTIEHIGLVSTPYRTDKLYQEDGDIQAFKEMLRVLKKNGNIILTIPYGYGSDGMKSWIRFYNKERLEKLIGDNFVIDKTSYTTLDNGSWIEISQEMAEIMPSEQNKVMCNLSLIGHKI